jgi:large subunit ribosomal protein L29
MKIKELREKSDVELNKMLTELQSKLQDLRFSVAGRRLKRVREMRDIKKGIARIMTLMKERELASKKVEAPVEKKPVEAEKKEATKEEAPADTAAK